VKRVAIYFCLIAAPALASGKTFVTPDVFFQGYQFVHNEQDQFGFIELPEPLNTTKIVGTEMSTALVDSLPLPRDEGKISAFYDKVDEIRNSGHPDIKKMKAAYELVTHYLRYEELPVGQGNKDAIYYGMGVCQQFANLLLDTFTKIDMSDRVSWNIAYGSMYQQGKFLGYHAWVRIRMSNVSLSKWTTFDLDPTNYENFTLLPDRRNTPPKK
jgi:hypothetical protein